LQSDYQIADSFLLVVSGGIAIAPEREKTRLFVAERWGYRYTVTDFLEGFSLSQP